MQGDSKWKTTQQRKKSAYETSNQVKTMKETAPKGKVICQIWIQFRDDFFVARNEIMKTWAKYRWRGNDQVSQKAAYSSVLGVYDSEARLKCFTSSMNMKLNRLSNPTKCYPAQAGL